jgi:hypothetical protein
MILWVLLINLHMPQAVAVKSDPDCRAAAAQLKVPAECVAFAADIPEGKKL